MAKMGLIIFRFETSNQKTAKKNHCHKEFQETQRVLLFLL